MKLGRYNPILYLEEYTDIPEDIYRWKQDGEIHPWLGWSSNGLPRMSLGQIEEMAHVCPIHKLEDIPASELEEECIQSEAPNKLSVGIGRYHTEMDGDIYLCVLLDMDSKAVASCSFGVYRSPDLVRKALEIYFLIYPFSNEGDKAKEELKQITLLCSRNPIYQKKAYWDIVAEFPIKPMMTEKGTRGGAAAVSTYFSQLMRRKGSTVFYTWQDAVDWISEDITWYNEKRQKVGGFYVDRKSLIEYCLTLPGAYEDYPFHDPNWTVIRLRASRKVFAWIFERQEKLWVNVKVDPEWRDFWRDAFESIVPAYHLNKEHWNSLILDGSIPLETVEKLIAESYELVKGNQKT